GSRSSERRFPQPRPIGPRCAFVICFGSGGRGQVTIFWTTGTSRLHSQVSHPCDSLDPPQFTHRRGDWPPTGAPQASGQIVNVAAERPIVLSQACNVAHALLLVVTCPAARWVAEMRRPRIHSAEGGWGFRPETSSGAVT